MSLQEAQYCQWGGARFSHTLRGMRGDYNSRAILPPLVLNRRNFFWVYFMGQLRRCLLSAAGDGRQTGGWMAGWLGGWMGGWLEWLGWVGRDGWGGLVAGMVGMVWLLGWMAGMAECLACLLSVWLAGWLQGWGTSPLLSPLS